MSNLVPKIIPLAAGLDLSSPKLLAEPGSLLDCLNYEMTDIAGYKRIEGFQRYDGSATIKDIPRFQAYTASYTGTVPGTGPYEDVRSNIVGYVLSFTVSTVTFVPFDGTLNLDAYYGFGPVEWSTVLSTVVPTTMTQTQLITLESYLRGLVTALPETPVGLHWYDNFLYAVVPLLMVPYAASVANEAVEYTIGASVTSTEGGTAILLDKVVTIPASALLVEQGYLILTTETGDWEAPVADTDTLSGAISVASGVVYHQPGSLTGMSSEACSLWKARRPSWVSEPSLIKFPTVTGWSKGSVEESYTLTLTLTMVWPTINTLRNNNTVLESTYYFKDSTGDIMTAVVLDYFVVSGSLAAGDAVIRLQVADLTVYSGTPGTDLTTDFEMHDSSSFLSNHIGDVTVRMAYNYLPGLPLLLDNTSRYEFKTANFYASDDLTQMYGVSGAGRGFVFDGTYLSFIYTQDDDDLDKPRHLENHHLHLALGFRQGSVQMSVAGQPTNFDGSIGAVDIGVGDRVTGLMEVEGTTLVVFCEQSIWSIVGTSVDNFQTQTIAPNTGCIEYSLANCGFPVYLDNRGISTLQTSANYGDFTGSRLSSKIGSWLVPRCRSTTIATDNSSGVACAIPVRHKNQYRLFFNDGAILTMTFLPDGADNKVGFTFQKYYLNQSAVTDTMNVIIPICASSEMDTAGVERTHIAHYNLDSPVASKHVFALDSGASFDGNYIPHYFLSNWYFADNPAQFQTLQGIRLFGLSKGVANLKVQSAGAQNDMYFGGTSLTTTTTPINLPKTPTNIEYDFKDTTTRAEIVARGLATQLKFSGSNTDLSLIEPSHVAQVLITYSVPDGAFDL